PGKPHPYADDPRLDAALDLLRNHSDNPALLSTTLARQLATSARTAQRILNAARELTKQPRESRRKGRGSAGT
ncbi:MAG: hypothetical protein ACRDT8_18475, partial [Micromonosporaceae bacterium]